MTREQAEEMVNRYGRSCMDQVIGKVSIREHFIVRNALIAALAPESGGPCTSTTCSCEMGQPDESCTDRRPIPKPNALDEQHVQYVAAPVNLIEAMNWGKWRKGVIIFRGPHGEEARMYLHGIEPWPMVAPSSPSSAQGEGERICRCQESGYGVVVCDICGHPTQPSLAGGGA